MSWTEAIRRALRRVDVRVATTLAATLAPLIGALTFLFYAYAAMEALEEIDRRTRIRIDELEQAVAGGGASEPAVGSASLAAALTREGIVFTVLAPDGHEQLRNGQPADPERLHHFAEELAQAVLISGGDLLHYSRQLPSGPRIEATVALTHFAEERSELAHAAWFCLGGGLAAAALLALVATRRAMAPLRGSTASIDQINASQLDARLPLRGTRDDVDRHAAAVNRVLERLDSAFARMNAFSSDVAHELRTPVNRILNLAEVALLDDDEAQRRKALASIHEAADQMGRLVEGLLTLARGEQGKLRLSLDRVSVAEILSDLRQLYAPACEERGIVLDRADASGIVRADRTLLYRALANLLDNALGFTPRGGRILVRAVSTADGISIDVCDSGRGIPACEREAVFERFARLDPARSGPGTGLGLPIARMIARVHGGDLVAADSPLGGACLSLRLPEDPEARRSLPQDGARPESVPAKS